MTTFTKSKDGVTRAQVFFKEGGNPLSMREEAVHISQLAEGGDTAQKIGLLTEENLAKWPKMSTEQRLDIYKAKIEVEIDAQKRLLQKFGKGDPKYVQQVEHNLENLQARMAEVDLGGKNPKSVQDADWLQEAQKPRLFSKSSADLSARAMQLTNPAEIQNLSVAYKDGLEQNPKLAEQYTKIRSRLQTAEKLKAKGDPESLKQSNTLINQVASDAARLERKLTESGIVKDGIRYKPEPNLLSNGKHGLDWEGGATRIVEKGNPQGKFGSIEFRMQMFIANILMLCSRAESLENSSSPENQHREF